MRRPLKIATAVGVGIGIALSFFFYQSHKPKPKPPVYHAVLKKELLKRKLLTLTFVNNVYISQSGAGGQTGADCNNAKPVTYFNNVANWTAGSPTGIQIGPGTGVHLCGSISTSLTMQGSGGVGSPVGILFEPGAKLSQTVCPVTGCFNGNGKTDFALDGLGTGNPWFGTFVPNGIIESTQNGSALANQIAASELINIDNTNRVTIQNLVLQNAYVHSSPSDLAPTQPDPSAVHAQGASNLTITNNQIHDALWALYFGLQSSNITVSFNDIYNSDHDLAPSVTTQTMDSVFIHHNILRDWSNWDTTTNKYHHDGVHNFQAGGGTFSHVYIYNNLFEGDQGVNNTAHIFNEGSTAATSIWVFNNVFTSPAGRSWNNGSLCLTVGSLGSGHAYNNTVVTISGQAASLAKMEGTNSDFRNNVIVLNSPGGGGPAVNQYGNTPPTFVTGGLDFNFYGISPTTGQYFVKTCGGACAFVDFPTWKPLFAPSSGQEANSLASLPSAFNVNTTTGIPGAGSTLFGKGTNLTALCVGNLTPLCTDFNGVARPATGSWDPGAYQSGSAGSPVLSFSPNPAAFGNQLQATTSAPLTITVSNSGTAAQTLSTPYWTITGTNANNFANAGTGTCTNGGSIPVSGSCTVNLTFTPSATGSRTATLTIQGTIFATEGLTGTGTLPVIGLSPSPAAFGNQVVSTPSSPLTVTVTNTGTATETLASPYFTITGTNSTDFTNLGTGTCANGGLITASGSCTINLRFTPAAAGARSATLNLLGTVNASDSLTGTGTQAAISVTPSPGAFGNQNVNTTSGPLTLTVTNTGTATETLSTPYFTITGTNSSNFANAGTGTCANGGTIAPSATCTVNLTFTPSAAGARSGTLNILGTVNGSDSLTGTGVAPVVSLSPTSIAFGNQTINTSSGNQAVTLTNTGTSTLTITSITLTGANAAEFSTNSSTCGASLVAGASCSLNVVFTPTTAASKTANLTFTTSAATSPDNVALTGTGVVPAVPVLSFSPSPGAFGNQLQNTTSAGLTVTVSNIGTGAEVLSTPFFTITGANGTDFARSGGTCANGGTIAVSGSCTVILTFTPLGTGSRTGTLNISGTANGSNVLTGTGIQPIIGLSPSPAAFGNQLQGTTSGGLTVTVSNTGTGTETLGTPFFTITGTNASNFAQSGGTCVNAGTIAPSASCTIILTFTPSATGARTATLTIQGTVNATDSLTGTGTFPAVALAPNPMAFGNQNVNTTSSPVTVTLSNTGTASEVLATPYFTITGTNSTNFANAGTGTCANGGTVAASSSCTINLTFTPSATGSRTATLNVFGTVNATTNLSGTGIAAVVSLNPTSIAFGNQTTSTSSGNTLVTLTNTGTATLTISSIALTGTNSNQFSTNGSTCGATLAAAASCTLNVVFSPTTIGAKSASLTFSTSAASTPDNVTLTGTGVSAGTPALSFSPTPADFGSQTQATTGPPLTITVTNTGTAPEVLSTPYFVIGGTNGTNFANSLTGTCANGGTIAASSSCTVIMTFTPSAIGTRSGTLTIQGTVNGSNPLTGIGQPTGAVSLTPTSIAFGNQDSGTTSNPRSVVLVNIGGSTLTITSIALTGTNANQFLIDTNTCGATLAASASCSWNVSFSPNVVQSDTANVTVTTSASTSPDNIPLTGTGRTPTPPSTPAPAIVIVRAFPVGSVLVNENAGGVSPKNFQVSLGGCSQDGVNFQNPCRFAITCGNCGRQTTVRFNGTQVSQSYSKGVVTVSIPVTLFTLPATPTDYSFSLLN